MTGCFTVGAPTYSVGALPPIHYRLELVKQL